MNVTVTNPKGAGYVTVWPAGTSRPTASNLNYGPKQTVANQAILKLGTRGRVSLFTQSAADLIIDVTGYYPSGAGYTALTPTRVVDTRNGTGTPRARVATGGTLTAKLTGKAGVPASGVAAVVVNVTAVNPSAAGYLTTWPAGAAKPTASSLNYGPKQTVAGMVIAKVGASGQIQIYSQQGTDLLVDVAGWIPTTSNYTPLTPTRVLDTRNGTGAPKTPVVAGRTLTVPITGVGGVPTTSIIAVEATITAVTPTGNGYLTSWPAAGAKPTASSLNFTAGATRANSVTLKVDATGKVNLNSTAATNLLLDITGYWSTPATTTATYNPATTKIVPAAKTSTVTPPTAAGGTGTFTTDTSAPAAVGQYVYLPPGGANGDGLAGQVTAVNGTTTTVKNVPLQQVFTSGDIQGTSTGSAPTTSTSRTPAGKGTALPPVKGGCSAGPGLPLDISLGTPTMRADVETHWGPGQKSSFKASMTMTLPIDVSMSATSAISCELSSKLPIPFRLPAIGPFIPEVDWVGDVQITGAVAKTTATFQAATTTGVSWTDGQPVIPFTDPSIKLTGVQPPSGTNSSLTATFETGPQVAFLLGGITGPSISAKAYFEDIFDTGRQPAMSIEVGVRIGANLTFQLLLLHVDVSLATVTVWHKIIWPTGASNNPPPAALAITTSTLPAAHVGTPYTATLTATGGAPPYTWSATGLPPGLTLNSSTGTITGTPTTTSTSSVTITARDTTGTTARTLTLTTTGGNGTEAMQVSAGGSHTCALLGDGTIKCWGYNSDGELGNGTNAGTSLPVATPVTVPGITTATQITTGDGHTCALLGDGTIKCWGYNRYGQLGNGTNAATPTPVTVPGITTATQITAGGTHTCALLGDGTIECWGDDYYGQLGNGTTTNSTTPVTVTGITTATQITTGGYGHTCALLGDGTIKCWGYNAYGQLGNGTTTDSLTPVTVVGITAATQITTGYGHACALLGDGTIKCWGYNRYGQLGNGTTTDSLTPVTVVGLG